MWSVHVEANLHLFMSLSLLSKHMVPHLLIVAIVAFLTKNAVDFDFQIKHAENKIQKLIRKIF